MQWFVYWMASNEDRSFHAVCCVIRLTVTSVFVAPSSQGSSRWECN